MSMKRFTVSLPAAEYLQLRELGESQVPPLNLQYLVRLAILRLIDQQSSGQLSLPMERR